MASTKKVSIGQNSIHLIFSFSIFLKFFGSFVGCSLCMFNGYSKKFNIVYFSKLLCSTVSLQKIKTCVISVK